MGEKNYRQGVAEALAQEMLHDPRTGIVGEDNVSGKNDKASGERSHDISGSVSQQYQISGGRQAILSSVLFVVCVAFLALILYREVAGAFMTNPGLNGLILAVFLFAVINVFAQLLRLRRGARWFNTMLTSEPSATLDAPPDTLVPLAKLVADNTWPLSISAPAMQTALELTLTRLDDDQRLPRDIVHLLFLLGLVGTFWGGVATVGSVADTIQALSLSQGESASTFEDLKEGFAAPISGLAIAFSSSLFGFGLALTVMILCAFSTRAQMRFGRGLEDWLVSVTDFSQK